MAEEAEKANRQLTPEQFRIISGKEPVPGQKILQMMHFDPARCRIEVLPSGRLQITQEGSQLVYEATAAFWEEVPVNS